MARWHTRRDREGRIMENMTLGEIFHALKFIIEFVGIVGTILIGSKKIINKQLEPINKKIIKIPDKIIISRSPQPCLLSFIFMSSRQISILPLFLSLVRGLSHCPSQNPSCPIKAIGSSNNLIYSSTKYLCIS